MIVTLCLFTCRGHYVYVKGRNGLMPYFFESLFCSRHCLACMSLQCKLLSSLVERKAMYNIMIQMLTIQQFLGPVYVTLFLQSMQRLCLWHLLTVNDTRRRQFGTVPVSFHSGITYRERQEQGKTGSNLVFFVCLLTSNPSFYVCCGSIDSLLFIQFIV